MKLLISIENQINNKSLECMEYMAIIIIIRIKYKKLADLWVG